jgi:hypothetical protein
MKITIEFNLPDDSDRYRSVINAGAAWDALQEIHYRLRSHLKHDVPLRLDDLLAFTSETLSTCDHGLEI